MSLLHEAFMLDLMQMISRKLKSRLRHSFAYLVMDCLHKAVAIIVTSIRYRYRSNDYLGLIVFSTKLYALQYRNTRNAAWNR